MGSKSRFERDFPVVEERFPKLVYKWNGKSKTWVITGELDICDKDGIYWNTFDIAILVPQSYPYCVPTLIERSDIIPRDIEWHISPEGICCVDIEHNLVAMSKRGINLNDFIANKIYTYLANQLYKLAANKYAGSEYAHHLEGIIQYYLEEHHLSDKTAIVLLLHGIVSNPDIGRNDRCPCGSNIKVKHCHLDSIDTIISLGLTRIKADLESIKASLA